MINSRGAISTKAAMKSIKKANKIGFKQRLRNWLFDEGHEKVSSYYEDFSISSRANFEGGMNFTVHKASGGLVVNVHYYDSSEDRSTSNLYVIQDDDAIGEQLSKILTMENLKR